MSKADLPPGLQDVLPPRAAHRSELERRIISVFAAAGYDRVSPPPLEFLETLDPGADGGQNENLLKLMDPISHRTLGFRNDFTAQLTRLAATSMASSPRPLRLCYCGTVVSAKGNLLHPSRFWWQAGLEVFAPGNVNKAVTEVISLGLKALQSCGVEEITLDLNYPMLEESLYQLLGKGENRNVLRAAIARKTPGALKRLNTTLGKAFGELLELPPKPSRTAAALAKSNMPESAKKTVEELIAVGEQLIKRHPDLNVHIDPLERRGFGYYSGITFSYFCKNGKGEIGRGGNYESGGGADKLPLSYQKAATKKDKPAAGGEEAVGLSLFIDVLQPHAEMPIAPRIFADTDADPKEIERLRKGGAVVITHLGEREEVKKLAKRFGCHQLLSKTYLTNL